MKIRITVDRDVRMSYVYLPTKQGGEVAYSTLSKLPALPGDSTAAIVAVDISHGGEMAGVEIEGTVTEVEFVDITSDGDEP